MARAPKADMAKVRAYEASPEALINRWLCFEAEYHDNLAEAAALGSDW